MHVLLLAADPAVADALAAAWRAGASGTAEPAVLPPGPARPHASGAAVTGAPEQRPAVFVPLAALVRGGVEAVDPHEQRLRALAAGADLVVVHLEVLDGAALHEPPLTVAARAAAAHALPLVVLAGRAEAGRREWSAAGVGGVHEVGLLAAEDDAWAARVGRAARTWAPGWA